MALITVVTAAKNAAAFLPEAIASVRAQTIDDWSLVVVDDGSTDETPAVVSAAADEDPRVRLVRLTESVGPFAAANVAMLNADSKYLARLDADDIARPDRLETQLDAMTRVTDARACAGGWRIVGDTHRVDERRTVPSHDNGVIKWMMWFRSNLLHSTLFIDTDYFVAGGGYGPERIGEDYRIWSRVVRDGALAVVDDPVVDYRVSAGQMTQADGVRDQPERLRITLDHMQACAPGDDWTLDDAKDLRWVGSGRGCSPTRGLALLARFERAWQADASLSPNARTALKTMTAARRLRHLRRGLSEFGTAVPLAAVQHPVALVRASLQVARNRGVQWP